MLKHPVKLMDDNENSDPSTGGGTTEAPKESTTRKIKMNDGRDQTFGEKQKIKKDYGVRDGNVFALIDFDNGQSIEVLIDPASEIAKDAMGHGLVQKLGDAAAGANSTDDAYEAILEVAARLNKGQWTKEREGGGGSAKGASELVVALTEYLNKPKELVREMLQALSAADKMTLRKVKGVAAIIERNRAAKEPTKAEAEKLAAAEAALEKMRAMEAPAEAPAA